MKLVLSFFTLISAVSVMAAGRLGGRVEGRASLKCMLGYVTKLRSMTRGLGQVQLRPIGYARHA
jgi:translation elongation factor EF-G